MGFEVPRRILVGANLDQLLSFVNRLALIVDGIMSGRTNNVFTATLTAGAATTTVANVNLRSTSAISFDPLTANAAAELANGTLYCLTANRMNGSFTLTHANNAQTDRTYRIMVTG